jgi:hypothetical protein
MSTNDLLNLTRRRPFVPFRIVTSDGTVYEVPHPDLIMVGLSSVIIGYPSDQEPHAYSRWDVVSLRHVIRLEPHETGEQVSPAESA